MLQDIIDSKCYSSRMDWFKSLKGTRHAGVLKTVHASIPQGTFSFEDYHLVGSWAIQEFSRTCGREAASLVVWWEALRIIIQQDCNCTSDEAETLLQTRQPHDDDWLEHLLTALDFRNIKIPSV